MTSSKGPTFYFNYELNPFTAPEARCELSCDYNRVLLTRFLKGSCIKREVMTRVRPTAKSISIPKQNNGLCSALQSLHETSFSATKTSPPRSIQLVMWRVYKWIKWFAQSIPVSNKLSVEAETSKYHAKKLYLFCGSNSNSWDSQGPFSGMNSRFGIMNFSTLKFPIQVFCEVPIFFIKTPSSTA